MKNNTTNNTYLSECVNECCYAHEIRFVFRYDVHLAAVLLGARVIAHRGEISKKKKCVFSKCNVMYVCIFVKKYGVYIYMMCVCVKSEICIGFLEFWIFFVVFENVYRRLWTNVPRS